MKNKSIISINHSNKIYSLSFEGLNSNYKNDVEIFNRFADGNPITANLISDFFIWREKNVSLSTLQRNKAAIKQALKLSMGQGAKLGQIAHIDAFFKSIEQGKGTCNNSITENKVLTKNQLKELIAKSGFKTGLIIQALYQTATRVSELCNIELKRCKIIQDESSFPYIRIKIFRQKTNSYADVFMDYNLFEKIKAAYSGKKYLFEKNGKPISRFTVHSLVKRAGAKIGRNDIHAHTLRHSWASNAITTLGLSKVSKYLSHSSPDVTARYYLHGNASAEEIMTVNKLENAE